MPPSVSDRLLDATIRCLAEHGYAATTTRRVAELAGVSQGAQQHYFPTKSALVEAALQRLMDRLLADAVSRNLEALGEQARAAALLDMILEIHQLPITPAVLELFTAARTDATLGACTARMTSAGMEAITAFASEALPSYAAHPGFADLIQVAMATARGTAILAAVPDAAGSHPSWDAVRRHLAASLEALHAPMARK